MQQPFLTNRSAVVAAPVQAWSALDGQTDATGGQRVVEGLYCGDTRVVQRVLLSSSSHQLEHVATTEPGGARAVFSHVVRTPELGVDPALLLERARTVDGEGVTESLLLRTAATSPQQVRLAVELTPDATAMQEIKQGLTGNGVDGLQLTGEAITWQWRDERTAARLTSETGTLQLTGDGCTVTFEATVPARGSVEFSWRLELHDAGALFVAGTAAPLTPPAVAEHEHSLRRLLHASFADINGLRLAHPSRPGQHFLAAGAPWYFTLFGRDSLISARNLLPHDVTTAAGTLAVLAGLQGTKLDVDAAEQPGKILHEVRQAPLEMALAHMGQEQHRMQLPPLYYGTIDATCLWIMLLDEAEQAGLDHAQVRELLPALHAALGWLEHHGDADGDGFLEYVDASGHGLTNQGWKDSGDSVRFADGSLAQGAVALAEVQGYAHAAALAGARLLEAFEGDAVAAEHWRGWAAELSDRFRAAFWACDELGRYPVLALDGAKQQVTGVASNMGHLLGTGILIPDEQAVVVERLMHPSMRSGFGIRTLSTTNGGYWPLGYHVGSVWTHDTAFVIDQMLRDGFTEQARILARELLAAAEHFGHRLPELYGGDQARPGCGPVPYPASCRPQAWAATSAVVIARALA